jgi:hypothetical protein
MVRIFSKDWIVFDAHNSTLADAWDNQVRDLANKIQSPENPVANIGQGAARNCHSARNSIEKILPSEKSGERCPSPISVHLNVMFVY